MARPSTERRVYAAVLDLVTTHGASALTMEGIAAHAGTGKQTLYRSWPSVPAILFDALVAHSAQAPPPAGPELASPAAALEHLLAATTREITSEPHASLLRAVGAAILSDETMAREFRERLLAPQRAHMEGALLAAGVRHPERAAETLLAPLFYRWFMGLPPVSPAEISWLVTHALAADGQPRSPS